MAGASESHAERIAQRIHTQTQTQGIATSAEVARERAFEEHELVAMAWQSLSRFPAERAIAASRWKRFGQKLDPTLGLYALCEVAFNGYHAKMFTEKVALDRQAHLREVMADQDKIGFRRSASDFVEFMRSIA